MTEPEAPRLKTVVLRAGPPKPPKAQWDVVAGVAGAALLLLSVALFFVLPEEDMIVPQFQVQVAQVQENRTSERLVLMEGDSVSVPFEVTHDNVFYILVEVGFTDDIPSSMPDTFEVTVHDPEGNLVGDRATVANDPGRPDQSAQGLQWEAVRRSARLSFDLVLPPADGFVSGEAENTTAQDVAQRFLEENHRETSGTWTVKVTLRDAGDCPAPSPEAGIPPNPQWAQQPAVCQATAEDGADPGNPFSIELFQYTYFEPRVSEL